MDMWGKPNLCDLAMSIFWVLIEKNWQKPSNLILPCVLHSMYPAQLTMCTKCRDEQLHRASSFTDLPGQEVWSVGFTALLTYCSQLSCSTHQLFSALSTTHTATSQPTRDKHNCWTYIFTNDVHKCCLFLQRGMLQLQDGDLSVTNQNIKYTEICTDMWMVIGSTLHHMKVHQNI